MKISPFIICALFLLSCKKDKAPSTPTANTSIPTTVGSYWIYECNDRDVNGVITPMGITDTIRIVGDTLIGGNTFITYEGTFYGYNPTRWYHRDSSGYVINQNSEIQYTTLNNYDTLFSNVESNVYTIDRIMFPTNGTTISVPAGNFNPVDYQIHCRKLNQQPFSGCGTDVYIAHNYYVPSIGLIMSNTIFFNQLESTCNDRVRVLKEYHIE